MILATKNYSPDRYRLVTCESEGHADFEEFCHRFSFVLPDDIAVADTIWTPQEFLRAPWIAAYLNDDADAFYFRDMTLRRYPSGISAAHVALDYAAECFDDYNTPVITANSSIGCVTKAHVRELANTPDIRKALHTLYDQGLLIPLLGVELLAPNLVLEARVPSETGRRLPS